MLARLYVNSYYEHQTKCMPLPLHRNEGIKRLRHQRYENFTLRATTVFEGFGKLG